MKIQSPTTKSSERKAWLTTQIAKHFIELAEVTAKDILAAKMPANAPGAAPVKRGGGRPVKGHRVLAAKSNGSGQTVDAAVLNTIAAMGRRGIRRDALKKMLASSAKPNHVGRAVARHLKYERIVERDERLYTTKAWVAKHSIPSRPQEETGATA